MSELPLTKVKGLLLRLRIKLVDFLSIIYYNYIYKVLR